ncbi:MAG: TolC family protein, partial [Bacteroidia bacterium]|nr:TolC family protein [Bacteroidia bacterium]
MLKKIIYSSAGLTLFLVVLTACKTPSSVFEKPALKSMPAAYHSSKDTSDSGKIKWKDFFHDPNLVALIDSALKRNQELNITLQEIEIARNEIRARKGEYLPFVRINGGADVEKTGLYTRYGANDATTDIKPGTATPDPLQNYMLGAYASWELDVWNKLHNAKNAAANRYLASIEGKNFLVTNLISEIAESYYELLMLDNQLEIVKKNIAIQSNALEMVRLQKQAARVTELAVKKFEAEVFNTRSLQFGIQQKIIEAENRINFLTGRYPQPVARNSQGFDQLIPDSVRAGIPSQLLENRPDIRQAERQLIAARLDVRSAKANFYPAFRITAGMGYEAFNPAFFLKTPESMLYSLAGDLVSP